MSDQTDSQVANEDTNAPQAEVSQKQPGETQTGNSLAGEALADALFNDPEAREIARRKLQSQKDKGVEKAKQQSTQAVEMVQKIANVLGIDPTKINEAQRKIVLDELINERLGNFQEEVGGQPVGEAQQSASLGDIEAIQKVYRDLDWNSNEVLAAQKKYANDRKGFLAELGEIRIKQAGKPKASPTEAVLPGGGSPPSNDLDLSEINDPEELIGMWLDGK